MSVHVVKDLQKLDALKRLPNGQEGVQATLQYQSEILADSRAQRKDVLKAKFQELASELKSSGVSIDLGSISSVAQMAEAVIPLQALDRLKKVLEKKNFRMDLVFDRNLI